MKNMPMCPMMMGQMPMMPMMNMPMAQMPMMQPMNMNYDEDDRDEEYFAGMYGENHRIMMAFVMKTVDKMDKKGDMIYMPNLDREMVERMSEESYNNMVKDMPEMADEYEEERQFGGRRRFGRDLIRLLLLNELLRRRRRRRRRDHGFWDNDYNSFGYDNDFYYNE